MITQVVVAGSSVTPVTVSGAISIAPSGIIRGDADGDGSSPLSASDAAYLLNYLYLGGPPPTDYCCGGAPDLDSGDANDNEYLTIADPLMIFAAIFCGVSIPPPALSCAADTTGPGLFPAVETSYSVTATVIPGATTTEVAVIVDSPLDLKAISVALDFGPNLTPRSPAFVLHPALNADSMVVVDGNRALLVIQPSGGPCATLTGSGSTLLGSFWFDVSPAGVCPIVEWLPAVTIAAVTHFATVVDSSYVDHHPRHELDTPCGVFIRGDANVDGSVDIADVVLTLDHTFAGAPVDCRLALDSNDDGLVNIADGIYTLGFLFSGGPAPPAPHPGCGLDATVSPALDCDAFAICP